MNGLTRSNIRLCHVCVVNKIRRYFCLFKLLHNDGLHNYSFIIFPDDFWKVHVAKRKSAHMLITDMQINRFVQFKLMSSFSKPFNVISQKLNKNIPVTLFGRFKSNNTEFTTDKSLVGLTIDKKLKKLMDRWDVHDAVELLQTSVLKDNIPHQNTVLNLLQQLANLGEPQCLLDLHSFLLNKKLCTDRKFFNCLQEAYCNSGRVEEGVQMLKLLYHKTGVYHDVDTFFTLLGVMILRNFSEKISLLENFAEDCHKMGDDIPTAALWKCCMITGDFERAGDMLLKHEGIQRYFGMMVGNILSRKNKVDIDRKLVLGRLLDFPLLNLKFRLKAALYLDYSSELCDHQDWSAAINVLYRAKLQGLAPPSHKLQEILMDISEAAYCDGSLTEDVLESKGSDGEQKSMSVLLQELKDWCDSLTKDVDIR